MKKGFTLLELLVAITILIVGILGISQMVAQGMTYNVEMRQLLTARHLMDRRMENFEILRKADPWLVDPEGDPNNLDYDDVITPDHQDFQMVDAIRYDHKWNVVHGRRGMDLDDRFRTLRLFIEWTTTKYHRISSDFIRWEER